MISVKRKKREIKQSTVFKLLIQSWTSSLNVSDSNWSPGKLWKVLPEDLRNCNELTLADQSTENRSVEY